MAYVFFQDARYPGMECGLRKNPITAGQGLANRKELVQNK